MTRCLIVVSHPRPDSLTHAAYERVTQGLASAGHDVRVIDLDAEEFDPRLTAAELEQHLGGPSDRSELADHFATLQWAQRIVLVYPTWFSGQPARLKGWFDRVWMHEVAFSLPDGATRARGKLRNIRRIDIVTTHGSSRFINFVQGNGGRLVAFRTMRVMCHPLCRTSLTVLYNVDRHEPEAFDTWLTDVGKRFAR